MGRSSPGTPGWTGEHWREFSLEREAVLVFSCVCCSAGTLTAKRSLASLPPWLLVGLDDWPGGAWGLAYYVLVMGPPFPPDGEMRAGLGISWGDAMPPAASSGQRSARRRPECANYATTSPFEACLAGPWGSDGQGGHPHPCTAHCDHGCVVPAYVIRQGTYTGLVSRVITMDCVVFSDAVHGDIRP